MIRIQARTDAMDWNEAVTAEGATLAHAVRKAARLLGVGPGRTLSSERVGDRQWRWNWSGKTVHVVRVVGRSSPAKLLTMPEDAWARLDALADAWGTSRSGTVARLVREAEMPKRRV